MNDKLTLQGENIVCIASATWDSMWVNAQHLMSRLGRNNRVLYVNNMGLRPPGASSSDLVKIFQRITEWVSPVRKRAPGIHVLSPIVLPFHGIKFIRRANERLLLWRVRRWMQRLDISSPVLWLFLPTGAGLIGRLGEKTVVYHCVDDYASNPNVPSALLDRMEQEILSKADISIVTSPKLYKDKKGKAKEIFYSPNSADVPRFRDFDGPAPERIRQIKSRTPESKILGYQGNISDYKTDIFLLEQIANTYGDHQLVLVGPAGWGDPSTDLGKLLARPNVHHLGRVPYNDLPAYLHSFDVALIPLNLNDSTLGSFPMKFYEYMACGKPIVATFLPAFENYEQRPQLVRLAKTREEFLEQIGTALEESPNEESRIQKRITEAEKNDWEERVIKIGQEVAKHLGKEKK